MLLRDREKRQWDSTFGRQDNEFVQKIVIFFKAQAECAEGSQQNVLTGDWPLKPRDEVQGCLEVTDKAEALGVGKIARGSQGE